MSLESCCYCLLSRGGGRRKEGVEERRGLKKGGLNQKCSWAKARARALAGKAEITLSNY